MILLNMELENFRQFIGRQEIAFAVAETKNVTVLHGFNGSGKTALLNAFRWCLYGQCSPDFERPDILENEAAYSKLSMGESMTVRVMIKFEDYNENGEKVKYKATRDMIIQKSDSGTREVKQQPLLTLFYIDPSGDAQPAKEPVQYTIDSIMPPELSPFFFFNGERIEELASPESGKNIDTAVRRVLDIYPIERAVDHLDGKISKTFRDRLVEFGSQDIVEAEKDRETISIEIAKSKEEQKGEFEAKNALEKENDMIDRKLLLIPEVKGLQEQRSELESSIKSLSDSIRMLRTDIYQKISRDAYTLIGRSVFSTASNILEDVRDKGGIPGPIRRQFVNDLLAAKQCICERDLKDNTPSRKAVEAWLAKTKHEDIEDIANTISAGITSLNMRAKNLQSDIQVKFKDYAGQIHERSQKNGRLNEISDKIEKQQSSEDPVALEGQRRKNKTKLDDIKFRIKAIDQKIQGLEVKLSEANKKITECKLADSKAIIAQKRLNATINVVKALKSIHKLRMKEIQKDLSLKLNEVWSEIAMKNYAASINEEFQLQMTKEIGGETEPVTGASSGERQILSLAFIAALNDKARSTLLSRSTLFRGALYPLVIDSAFGALEIDYRRDVTRWITKLAPQLIIMVSESQWRGEVETEMESLVGKQYILKYETPKKFNKDIILNKSSYPYVVQSDDLFERAQIIEVKR
jgi:DNA sulfur modification protein DndD